MDHLWTPWRYAYVSDTEPDPRKGVAPELSAWPGDLHCVFCNMLASADYAIEQGMPVDEAEKAAGIVYRGETVFLCLNRYPYNGGHVMVLPYLHEKSLAALDRKTSHEFIALAQRVELVLQDLYRPNGINMGLNLGKAAGAGVTEHLHLHALPRWTGDANFMTVIAETRVLPEELSATWQRFRDAFAQR
jgi:ATP adenylyltransferase